MTETSATPGPAPAPDRERVNARASIWYDFMEKKYWISFDYHQQFIDFLKAAIPKRARRYDPASKAWSFGRAYIGAVEAEAAKYFPDLKVDREPPRKYQPRAPRTDIHDSRDDMILEFFYSLPHEAMKSAYRKAALLLH